MKIKLAILLILAMIFINSCQLDKSNNLIDDFIPSEYKILRDNNCNEGETGLYAADGSRTFEGCKSYPSDLGKICESDDECTYSCTTNNNDLKKLGCDRTPGDPNFALDCPKIKGRCGAYGDFRTSIDKPGKVGFSPE